MLRILKSSALDLGREAPHEFLGPPECDQGVIVRFTRKTVVTKTLTLTLYVIIEA
jgi:hypothetical protein